MVERGEGKRRYHDGYIVVVDAVVVNGRLEEVGVLLQPGLGTSVYLAWVFSRRGLYHFGMFNGMPIIF